MISVNVLACDQDALNLANEMLSIHTIAEQLITAHRHYLSFSLGIRSKCKSYSLTCVLGLWKYIMRRLLTVGIPFTVMR